MFVQKSRIMIETEEMDPSNAYLESDIYPMTAATKLYSLICESIVEESIPKSELKSESFLVDPSVFTSAFKFLEKYQKKNQNHFETLSLSSAHQELSQNNCRTKCLTVFSSPYDRRKPKRLEQQSTELPESVKQMMEKDAALRRLLKTGNVTISLTSKSEDDNDDTISNSSNSSQRMTNNNISKQNKLLPSVQKHGVGANLLKKLAKKVSTSSLSSFATNNNNNNSHRKSVTTTTITTSKTKLNHVNEQDLFLLQTPPNFEELKRMKKVPNLSKSNIFSSDNNNYYDYTNNKSGTGFRLKNKKNSLEKGFLIQDNLIIPSTSASSSSALLTKCNRKIISKPQLQIDFQSNSDDIIFHQDGNQIEESKIILKSGSSNNNNVEFDPTSFLEVSFREEDTIENRRKYSCPHCIKKFAWSTDLKRHLLIHTGERPFKCEFCESAFTRKFLMQKHAKKFHPEEFLASTSKDSNQKMGKTSQNQTKINSSITISSSTIDTPTIKVFTSSTIDEVPNSLITMDEDNKEYDSITTSPTDNYSNTMFNNNHHDNNNDDVEEEEETEMDFQHFQQQEQFQYDDDIDGEIQGQFDEDVEIDFDLGNSSNCDNLNIYQEHEQGSDEDDDNIGEELQQDQQNLPGPPPLRYHDLYSKIENINSDRRDSNENTSSNEPGSSSAPILINVLSSLHQNSGMKPGPPPLKRFKKMDSDVDEEDDDVEKFSSITHHHVQRKFSSLTPVQS